MKKVSPPSRAILDDKEPGGLRRHLRQRVALQLAGYAASEFTLALIDAMIASLEVTP